MAQRHKYMTRYHRMQVKYSQTNDSNIFLVQPPKATETKARINKWDLIKLISFCTAKKIIHKTKRQSTDWEKIFANDATDKDLTSKIYKQLIQLNNKQPNEKIDRKPKQTFLQRAHTDDQLAHEKMLNITNY